MTEPDSSARLPDTPAVVGVVDTLLEETLGQLDDQHNNGLTEFVLTTFTKRAAALSLVQRALARDGAIRKLKTLRVEGAARLVDAAFAMTSNGEHGENGTGASAAFKDVESWGDPVDGADLLNTLEAFFRRFLILPEGAADVLAAFALVTHAADVFRTVPYLALESPTPECGKTRVLEILALLSARPWFTLMPSTAVLFRVLEEYHPTMLLDECQAVRGHGEAADNVRDLLLAGYKRGAKVPRCVGEQHEVQFFDVFGPKVFALIGDLPGALASRCIRIGMQRRRPEESVDSFLPGVEDEALVLAQKARRWAEDHREILKRTTPPFPGFLRDRLAETWGSLLAVGLVAGGGWDARLIDAARALAVGREDDDVRTLLLADIRTVFADHIGDRISSADLVAALTAIEGRPWADWKGRELTANALARLLKSLKIKPKKLKIGGQSVNGYELEAFTDAFTRYPPASEPELLEPSSNYGAETGSATGTATSSGSGCNQPKPQEKRARFQGSSSNAGEGQQKGSGPGLEPLTASFWSSLPEEVLEPDPDEEARLAMREGA